MEKYIKKCIEYNKSLKIDKDALFELDDLYKEIGATAEYSVLTEKNINYYFESLNELLEFDFCDEIKTLRLARRNYNQKANLDIILEVDYNSVLVTYGKIARISYATSDENIDIILNKKINEFYKKHKTYNWILGKLGLYLCFLATITCIVLFLNWKGLLSNNDYSVKSLYFFFYGILLGTIMYLIMFKVNEIICKKYFKPIEYYIGKQKEKTDKIDKIKSNIFWSVIVGLIVGIATTIICKVFE